MLRMRRVGEILQQERLKKQLSVQRVSQVTKIKEAYIEAIENGNYAALPISTFTKGLIANYAKFLGLNPEEILAIYRREFNETKEKVSEAPQLKKTRTFRLTPVSFVRLAIILIALGLFLYFIREYRILTGPPPLHLLSPKQNQIVKNGSVNVSGTTTSEAMVSINDENVTVDPDGSFAVNIDVPENPFHGENQVLHLIVVAKAKSGKENTIDRTIIVQ